MKRLTEHEASVRRFNKRTTPGQHMCTEHYDLKGDNIKNKVDLESFMHHFKPEIVKKGKDTLDVFIKEGLCLKYDKPTLNNMQTNGFIFV